MIDSGILYNLSGKNAVKLNLKNGTVIAIGSDDTINLLKAVNSHIS